MSDSNCKIILKFEVSMRKRILARIFKVRFQWRESYEQSCFRSITLCIRKRYNENTLGETCVSFKENSTKTYRKSGPVPS